MKKRKNSSILMGSTVKNAEEEEYKHMKKRKKGKQKLVKENLYAEKKVKLKDWIKGINFNAIIGSLSCFFFGDESEDAYDDVEMLESNNMLYKLVVYDLSEVDFVITLLKAGYTVIINLEKLAGSDNQAFKRRLQFLLFGCGIYYHTVSNNVLVVAPSEVEILDFVGAKKEPAKIYNLSDYKRK